MFSRRTLFVAVCIVSLIAPARAGKLGLVLSGGGAKGFAHLGVLKVLDEYNIPVSVISGTSIGALIGAFYSCGYSAREIEDILLSEDWKQLFFSPPNRRNIQLLEKDLLAHYVFHFKLRNNKIKLKQGLSSGQRILDFLSKYTELYTLACEGNFDNLYIPLRITATNLPSAEPVVFSSGNIAEAVRASIAYPGLLSPYEINGEILIDGFVFENIPVRPIRGMVDYILVSNTTANFGPKKYEFNDVLEVLDRTVDVLTEKKNDDLLQDSNVVVLSHNLDTYSILSFDEMEDIIAQGERTARQQLPALLKLTGGLENTKKCVPLQQYTIGRVTLEGLDKINRNVLKSEITLKPGRDVDINKLTRLSEQLYSMDLFEQIKYRLLPGPGKKVDVNFSFKEKNEGDIFFGYSYDNYYGLLGKAVVSASRMTRYHFRLLTRGLVGRYQGVEMNLFLRRLLRTNLLINVKAGTRESREKLYRAYDAYQLFTERVNYANVTFGYYLSSKALLQSTASRRKNFADYHTRYLSTVKCQITYDSLDTILLPGKGVSATVSFEDELAPDGFKKMSCRAQIYIPIRKNVYYLAGDYRISYNQLPLIEQYKIGGMDILPGYRINEFRDNNYYAVWTGIRIMIRKYNTLIKRRLYIAFKTGAAHISNDRHFPEPANDMKAGCGIEVILDTVLGTARIAYGRTRNNKETVYFTINEVKF